MKTIEDLRKEFEDLTGKGTEIPGFIGEPITFTQFYVHWLEKKVIELESLPELTDGIKKNIFVAGFKACENGWNIQKAEIWFETTYRSEQKKRAKKTNEPQIYPCTCICSICHRTFDSTDPAMTICPSCYV